MAGNTVTLDQASLNKLASMLGNNSAQQTQQRQPFVRQPMQQAGAGKKNTGAEARKAQLQAEKELQQLDKEMYDLDRKSERLARKSGIEAEAAAKRKLRIEKETAKWHDSASKNDEKAAIKSEKRLKALNDSQKKADVAHKKFQETNRKLEERMAKSRGEQLKHQKIAERHKSLSSRLAGNRARAEGATRGLQQMGGPIGSITQGVSAYKAAKGGPGGKAGALGAGLSAAGGAGGGLGDVLGSAGTGAQVGGIFGPWGTAIGAALGAAYEGAKKLGAVAAETGDDILKLTGTYIKSTNQIEDDTDAAKENLVKFGDQFKDSYANAIVESKKFGKSVQEIFDTEMELTKTISTLGGENSKTISKMTSDTYAFAAALNVPAETIKSGINTNMMALGQTSDQTEKALASMYSSVTAANDAFAGSLKGSKIRMDSFTDIMFESARKADVWTLGYEEVEKTLLGVAKASAEAGFSEERRQKMMKSTATLLQDQSDQYSNIMIGQRAYIKDLEMIKNLSPEKQLKAVQEKYGEQGAEARLKMLQRAQQTGGQMNQLEAGRYGEGVIGSKVGTQAKAESIRKDYLDKASGRESQLQIFKQLNEKAGNNLGGLELETAFDKFMKGNDEVVKALTGKQAAQAPGVKEGKPGGAAITEEAASGMIQSTKNQYEANAQLVKIAGLATAGIWGLVTAMDAMNNTMASATDQVKHEAAAKKKAIEEHTASTEVTGGQTAVADMYKKLGVDPTQYMQAPTRTFSPRGGAHSTQMGPTISQFLQSQEYANLSKEDRVSKLQKAQNINDVQAKGLVEMNDQQQERVIKGIMTGVMTEENRREALKQQNVSQDRIEELVKQGGSQSQMPAPSGMPAPGTAATLQSTAGPMSSMQSQQTAVDAQKLKIDQAKLISGSTNIDTGKTKLTVELTGNMSIEGGEDLVANQAGMAANFTPRQDGL